MRKVLMALALVASPAMAQTAPAWDAKPWLEDLAEIRAALDAKYANRDWLTGEREVDLDGLFARAEGAIRGAGSDQTARRVFDRMIERIGDGHVSLRWPRPAPPGAVAATAPSGPATAAAMCASLGYSSDMASPGTAAKLPGYSALEDASPFPAGLVKRDGAVLGVVRIGVFMPQGYPGLCEAAVREHAIPLDKPCDEACADIIVTDAYRAMGIGLETVLARLRAGGAQVVLVDISDNGGGSEWAEAAARMFSTRPLKSAPLGFVRGPHWAKQWGDLAQRLRGFAGTASPADRARLLAWTAEAEAAKREAETPCAPGTGCTRLGRAGFATGLVGEAPAGAFAGKEWGVHVFNPAQHAYRDGAWDGPVIVLTDGETWSAAEQFAAVLRDNEAAIVMGERSGGAGCGRTWGGTPTTLTHSRAVLEVPDCVRFRADGSNEVRGIIPDVLTGVRPNDGAALKAGLTVARIDQAIAAALEQYAKARPVR